MRRNDLVALVAGTSLGVVGGALVAGLASTIGGAALYRLLDQFGGDDQYFALRQPAMLTARQGDSQPSLRNASLLPPASALPHAGVALAVTAM